MIEEDFVTCSIALELKNLGYSEVCIGFYNPSYVEMKGALLFAQTDGNFDNWNKEDHLISAPLYQQVHRWFREKHNLYYSILPDMTVIIYYLNEYQEGPNGSRFYFHKHLLKDKDNMSINQALGKTYEEVEVICIKELINIVKTR